MGAFSTDSWHGITGSPDLQLYVSLGMKIKKIHQVMQFEQSCWMKPYIDLNTEKRKEATVRNGKAGKYLFKLFNNAVFGKTTENIRKRIKVEVVTSRKVALKLIARPIFSEQRYSMRIWLVFTWSSRYW